jgi:2,4'-dihydroxyacetophenone dioxygenase
VGKTRPDTRPGLYPDVVAELAFAASPGDERVWVPQAEGVWFRPLLLNTVTGQWCNLLRVSRSGVVSRHRHAGAVFGYVIAGRWSYYEHDWTAEAGHFVFEPPGEIHTLYVPEDCPEMITFFNISGAMIYFDEADNPIGYDDALSKLAMCRAHYEAVGLGRGYVEQFVR